jgi:hypothetical protein
MKKPKEENNRNEVKSERTIVGINEQTPSKVPLITKAS